jgi:transcriptional regulator with XRE-family HTH domain
MPLNKTKLHIAMLKAGITSSKELASLAGISVNTVSRLLNGGTAKITTLQRITAVLKVDVTEILEG